MKNARSVVQILGLMIIVPTVGLSQVTSKEMTFAFRVESADPGNTHVRFTSAYACQATANSQPFVVGEQETPFEGTVSGTQFLGMFRATSGGTKMKVSLSIFRNGVKCADAQGTGELNILHADPTGVGYGWPSTIGDISMIEDVFDRHTVHEK